MTNRLAARGYSGHNRKTTNGQAACQSKTDILLASVVDSASRLRSLRLRRRLVAQEARERAGRIAEDLSERIWNGLLGANADFVPIGPRSLLEVVGKSRDE